MAKGLEPLFQSHMWDGSAVPLKENMEISQRLLEECRKANIILEIEIGVVGGEEDGVEASHDAKLFSTVEDGLATAEALGLGENGRYMVAATFGNVHGVYKPGNVVLTPKVLDDIQTGRRSRSTARTSRSTSSSTVAPARCSARSARPSTTAS